MRRIININEIGANMVDRGAEIKRSVGSRYVDMSDEDIG
jgi:hypothetical protein